ncbi:hypothetical protein ACH42_15875 [Endozoicomonas sp. (ex Bugula neritina AB1)]|nr:hypothetical protein ACH42_15875 [Endozoicomonas sp. (ex Bugula neritina AB1)]
MTLSNTPSPFWQQKTLQQMSFEEWESLCDGCGRCCLHKLEDEETDEVYYTSVACQLLDTQSCRCKDYSNRKSLVPDCTTLTIAYLEFFHWLPNTCAYRLVSEGKPLPEWHPLISGTQESVHGAGISVRRYAQSELAIPEEDWEDYLIPLTEIQ